MVQLVVALMLLALPLSAQAASYYVATTGNNANAGTSEGAPWATVKKCVDTMIAGDTCYVRGGNYTETAEVRFTRSGTSSAPITLKAYQNETPVIQFADETNGNHRISIWNSAGVNQATGWIVIEGLTVSHAAVGIRLYSAHDVIIRNNTLYDNKFHGILGYGTRILITQNFIGHNGSFEECAAGTTTCNKEHGIYMNGSSITVRHNVIYDNLGYGIQLNGSSTSIYNPANHAGPEFAESVNWIISDNTLAYNKYRSGLAVWGSTADNLRVENNIFYENSQSSSSASGVDWVSATGSSGVLLRNNHFYASGSGGTAAQSAGAPADLVSTGNVVNVSAPAFVNGGSNSLPASPDFRLTANAPVNIARVNEFPNNSTLVAGAFKTLADPTCSITADRMTCTYASVTPIRNLSTTGVTVGCTGSACPGSPTVSTVRNIAGTDSQLETVITGIAGNACVSTNQTWTKTYNASTGTWTGGDNIGAYPGVHQKMFSFTNLAVTNSCTGSGPPTPPSGPYIEYLFTDGSGTTVTNTGSFGASGNGTLSSGVTWGTGSVSMTSGTSQSVSIPDGNAINPTVTNLTIGFLVNLPSGSESLSKTVFGAPLDTAPIEERFYISMLGGTWRLGIQATNDGTATDLSTNAGLQHICVTANATTDVVTLHKNGIPSVVAGGVRSITSYAIPGNFQLGLLPGLTNGPTATYSHFELYHTLEDCDALYQAAIAPPASSGDTFSQSAVQFEDVYTTSGGAIGILPSPSNVKRVSRKGAVAISAQIECNNCASTSFRLASRDNGVGDWQQVPTMESAANTYMWGDSLPQFINNGGISTRILANGCTVVSGTTQLTAAQIPSLTLPTSGCTILRYIVRTTATASGYTEFRIEKEGGVAFTGSYVLGRITIMDEQAGVGN